MIRGVLQEPSLELFAVELSLDGMPAFHDEFRKAPNSFRKAMETYDALADAAERGPAAADPRDLDGDRAATWTRSRS